MCETFGGQSPLSEGVVKCADEHHVTREADSEWFPNLSATTEMSFLPVEMEAELAETPFRLASPRAFCVRILTTHPIV